MKSARELLGNQWSEYESVWSEGRMGPSLLGDIVEIVARLAREEMRDMAAEAALDGVCGPRCGHGKHDGQRTAAARIRALPVKPTTPEAP